MKAVIPAAGFGTRFLPLTKAQPKEMLPVVNKPTIQWVVEEAVDAGITDIAIITGKHKQAIENHFRPIRIARHGGENPYTRFWDARCLEAYEPSVTRMGM